MKIVVDYSKKRVSKEFSSRLSILMASFLKGESLPFGNATVKGRAQISKTLPSGNIAAKRRSMNLVQLFPEGLARDAKDARRFRLLPSGLAHDPAYVLFLIFGNRLLERLAKGE